MTWLLSVVAIGLVAGSAPRVAISRGSLARLGVLVSLPILAACNAGSERSPIQTLVPGVVRIAVTDTTVADPLDPGQWMYRYAERLGRELDLRIEWVVVPFDKSWELAGKDVVDVVATNLASFSDRVSPGGTFSTPFLYEQRALRIRAADRTSCSTWVSWMPSPRRSTSPSTVASSPLTVRTSL
jgi:hypothetical protein